MDAAHHRIPLLIVMYNNRSYFNDEEHQILMANARNRPVENAHIGQRMDNPKNALVDVFTQYR